MWMAKLIAHEMIAEAGQNGENEEGNQEDEPERRINRYIVPDPQHGGEDQVQDEQQ